MNVGFDLDESWWSNFATDDCKIKRTLNGARHRMGAPNELNVTPR
jgi:hypothetical protein